MQYRNTALVLAALSLTIACGDDDDGPTLTTGEANVRVINASPTNASVSLANGSTTLASNVAFGTGAATCATVPAGTQTLTFRSGTTDLATTSLRTFDDDGNYTVILWNDGTTSTATVLEDEFTAPGAGNNAIRFVNATGTAGDVYLTTADGAITGTPTSGNLTVGASSTFATFPNTSTRARLFDVGGTETARGDVTIGTLTSGAGTVVFTDPATAGGASGFVVEPCS